MLTYLIEENRILRDQLHGRRVQLTDDERRRLAVRGQRMGDVEADQAGWWSSG